MFFDDSTPRKLNLRPRLVLASEGYGSERADTGAASARERLELARSQKETTPSLLDRIDAMTRAQEDAHHACERARATEAADARALQDEFARDEFTRETELRPKTHANPNEASFERDEWVRQGSAAPLVHPVYVLHAIRKWRNMIAATTILGGVVGLGIAATTPKLYYASTGILIDPRNYKVVENDINPDVFLSEASLAIVDSQLNIIRSPAVVDKVVTQLGLDKDSEFNGTKAGMLAPLTGFLDIMSGGKSEGSKLGAAIKNLSRKTDAKRQAGTFVVNISAYSEDPEKAALIANTIVDVYMAERADDRSNTAGRTTSAMQARLPELKKQVQVAENKVAKFKSENDLFDAQGRLIDDEEILRLNDQLSEARSNTITLNSRADSAKAVTVDGLVAGGLPEEISSNVLTSLRGQYTTTKQKYDGLKSKLGPMHPDLLQAGQEASSLKSSIESEIKRIRTSVQTELRRAVQTEQSLAARLAQLKAKLAQSGDALVKLREIEREATSARTVYEQFLLRAQETGEQGTIDSTNVKQTNVAKSSQESVGTSRKVIAICGLLGGFLLGLGLAILAGIVDALKAQYGGSLDFGRDAPPSPSAPSGPSRHGIRGAFHAHELENSRRSFRPDRGGMQGAYAQHAGQVNQVELPREMMPSIIKDNIVAPVQPAPLAPPPAPVMMPVAQQLQYNPVPVQQPFPVYAQQNPMFMPHMQQPWFQPPMPQFMIPQPAWHQQLPLAPVVQNTAPVYVLQQQQAEQPRQIEPAVVAQIVSRKPLSQNAQLDDIQESLAGMKAELLSLVRQRRHG
jgi:uncharacterized protein involved in exopolysaccharide biosynthesis